MLQEERLACQAEAEIIIEIVCNSNQDAKEYLNLLLSALRVIDDVYDQDSLVTTQDLMNVFEILFVRLPLNKFYQDYEQALKLQHVIIWNTWEVSNVLRNSALDYERMYGQVLSGYVHELLPLVANLTGGYLKMKEVNALVRKMYQGPLEDKNG